ncbi:hypothetical protein CAOG_01172 [Capsaspora owczarzaki ATCC 30864]|uniref:Nbr1 FW domain-containing protein n=1 Tax=Capsaspora owczarzaki (strain ATCC 30864) TaxID=595528 RepID=A0A0D2VIE5_CAPO3|nr:hypothetical protein CAOG_01172 [Capsaspora owczarzaki ATCC 30864]KJE89742.1 hypothetical protein CAOG_001172 [Capsaspora owczarzaki ATCC 30864]|eukprot:XP_004366043.1 hypothetical protein CAOG_01172 [Capsaspora owczarzaki ATCC 30864]
MGDDANDLLLMFQSMGTSDHDTLLQQFRIILPDADEESCRFFLEANNWSLQSAVASYFDSAGSGVITRQQQSDAEMAAIEHGAQRAFQGMHLGNGFDHPAGGAYPHHDGAVIDGYQALQLQRASESSDDDDESQYEDIPDSELSGSRQFAPKQQRPRPALTVVSEQSDATQVALAGQPFVRQWIVRNSGLQAWPPNCQLRFASGERMEFYGDASGDYLPVIAPGEETVVTLRLIAPAVAGEYAAVWRAAIIDQQVVQASHAAMHSNPSQAAAVHSGGFSGFAQPRFQYHPGQAPLQQAHTEESGGGAMDDGSGGQTMMDPATEIRLRVSMFGEPMWLLLTVRDPTSEAELLEELDMSALQFGNSQHQQQHQHQHQQHS